jgi:hypothetical protein
MSSNRFDDILELAAHDLNRDEQLKLIQELTKITRPANGGTPDQNKSLYDALNEGGMIGSIGDAPSDLGMNPLHMEGFGQHAP